MKHIILKNLKFSPSDFQLPDVSSLQDGGLVCGDELAKNS